MYFGYRIEPFSGYLIVDPGGKVFRAFQGRPNPEEVWPGNYCALSAFFCWNYVHGIDHIAIFMSVDLFLF